MDRKAFLKAEMEYRYGVTRGGVRRSGKTSRAVWVRQPHNKTRWTA